MNAKDLKELRASAWVMTGAGAALALVGHPVGVVLFAIGVVLLDQP